MIGAGVDQVYASFLVFCRIGTCMMLVPGISFGRVPPPVRLYLAGSVSIAAALGVPPTGISGEPIRLLQLAASECVIGAVIGIWCRLCLVAAELAGSVIANSIGVAVVQPGLDLEDQTTAVGSLISLFALVIFFVAEMPAHLLRALFGTFEQLPLGSGMPVPLTLRMAADLLAASFVSGLQISAPFLAYGVVVNLLFGILGRLVPQFPSYFVSAPFIAFGGLVLIWLALEPMSVAVFKALAPPLLRLM